MTATSCSVFSLSALENRSAFLNRHLGPVGQDAQSMLDILGYSDLPTLIDAVVPTSIRRPQGHMASALGNFSDARPEAEALSLLQSIAKQNQLKKSLIGQGYVNSHTPPVILRNVLENPAWYTAYTPYQPEISQGRLEAMLNFQQMVTDLTGMDIANASMLDEGTAAAEAMTLAQRVGKSKSKQFFVAEDVFPQTIAVVKTRAKPLGIDVVIGPLAMALEGDYFGVLIQYPGAEGRLLNSNDGLSYNAIADATHARGGLVIAACDLLALTLLTPPGEWGADVAIGNSQRFGVPLGFGGPHAAFMATRDAFKRSMPGRLVGVTVDANGKTAYRLALQTREQHIRREKATSNICTAQVLLAVMAGMYAIYHGPEGLKQIALRVQRLTSIFAKGLGKLGYALHSSTFFDTLTVCLPAGMCATTVHAQAQAHGFNLREFQGDTNQVGITFDETSTRDDVLALWDVFANCAGQTALNQADLEQFDADLAEQGLTHSVPEALVRQSTFLTHPVFHRYHGEHEMLRYLRSLADKDLALDRTMIPLGSCTMKLNATSEMLPITWAEFGGIHPFAPQSQWTGYARLISDLEEMLCAATGYAAISLQPNAGSQGEYAGLLVIQAYHASRGESHRNVCLIPSSAHGTNPASAQMVGMRVVVVACDAQGNVDLADLRAKAAQYSNDLAAIMITYPSTHGVFEAGVKEICEVIHTHGGQVYIDGANMNALVGTAAPGQFGGDVSHLNLHKTFCIPHGGGGPGVGPVAVAAHLAPFLPTSFTADRLAEKMGMSHLRAQAPQISAAPFGSASILPISWMYIAMMGAEGLTRATETAILAANYVAASLRNDFPVLYSGEQGLVAHECILDIRPLQKTSGISNEDVAKRLMDFGFHAPTMSFPVPGTLMIEPTESESKAELDRFIEAMRVIRQEIAKVESGEWDALDNPLKNAPHTAEVILADDWKRGYSREVAAYPVASLRSRKYWPPVGRADNVYGDRHLMCSCVPMSEFA